ncbi:integrase domain-containing protein [Pseudoalteromonas sp. JC28]|uniref:integrase domain-containing protein n=1 Tax=Pseudoalteromonas sp. JC28 TaxID=2267617 RepID=UPI0015730F3A|nr:integrase domain-containing protein [Pseudoalteromonas sp. JC28]
MRHERQNPNSRNFGLRSRDISKAGLNALKEDIKSFSSISTMHGRWNRFCSWLKTEHQIKDMRDITHEHLQEYSSHLSERCNQQNLSASTAQNYMSAVNRVMEIARGDRTVHVAPVVEGNLPKRSGIAKTNKSVSHDVHAKSLIALTPRTAALLELQRELGLRFEESAKLDAQKALHEALQHGYINIKDGTKGGRLRTVPVQNDAQFKALRLATTFQNGRSMIAPGQSYKQFKQDAYNELKSLDITFHAERHHYAQTRYQTLSNIACPAASGIKHSFEHYRYIANTLNISLKEAKDLDHHARMQVSQELGHGRIDVTNSYLG